MSKFYVDVQFKKQGCFSVEVLASDKQEATQKALTLARNCGCKHAAEGCFSCHASPPISGMGIHSILNEFSNGTCGG